MLITANLQIGVIKSLPDYGVAEKFQNCHTKFVTIRPAETLLQHCTAACNIANAWGEQHQIFHAKKYRTPSSLVEYLLSPYTLPYKMFAGWEYVAPRSQPPPPAAQPQGENIVIPERLREPKAHYPIRFTRQTENELQLVLEIKAILEGGGRKLEATNRHWRRNQFDSHGNFP